MLAVTLALASALSGAVLDPVDDFGDNPGALALYEHVPDAAGPLPLVLVLHGCGQTAQMAVDAGFVDEADRDGFLLAVAEQSTSNNAQACFDWFVDGDIARDQGEAASLAHMVAYMEQAHDVDPARVFVAGLSAGGAMAAVMLADYPDVFAAGAVFSGIPYRCGVGLSNALTCMQQGRDLSQADWAALVTAADAGFSGRKPRVSIWQGDADHTVNPTNADALVLQWTGVNGIAATPTSTEALGAATRERYGDVVERVTVPGMDHGIAVDPGHGCGTAGAFVLDEHLCASAEAAAFFGLAPADPSGEGEGEGEGEAAPPPQPAPAGCAGGGPGWAAALLALLAAQRGRNGFFAGTPRKRGSSSRRAAMRAGSGR